VLYAEQACRPAPIFTIPRNLLGIQTRCLSAISTAAGFMRRPGNDVLAAYSFRSIGRIFACMTSSIAALMLAETTSAPTYRLARRAFSMWLPFNPITIGAPS